MNKIRALSAILVLTMMAAVPHVFSQADEATTAAETESENSIQENIKKRIEQVVRNKDEQNGATLIALVGTLESRTKETLSIRTAQGIQLASTSAQTAIVNADSSADISLDDVSIDDYLSLIGYMNEENVLDTRRIIVAAEPAEIEQQPFFGTITAVDLEEDLMTLTQPDANESISLTVDRNSVLESINQLEELGEVELEDIASNSAAIVIYESEADEPNEFRLVKLLIKILTTPNAEVQGTTDTASEAAELDVDTPIEDIIPEDLQ